MVRFQLGRVLIESLIARGRYDAEDYLQRYLDFLLTPGRHRDTYVEECHRKFFTAYARGVAPRKCGGNDIHKKSNDGFRDHERSGNRPQPRFRFEPRPADGYGTFESSAAHGWTASPAISLSRFAFGAADG